MTEKLSLDQLRQAQSDAAQANAIRQLADKLPANAPQPTLLQRASALFRQRKQQAERSRPQRGTIGFDSWADGLALGMRKGVTSDRQLLLQFADANVDVDLQIIPPSGADGMMTVHGQLMADSDDLAGIECRLADQSGTSRGRLTGALGDFRFSLLPPADYTLTIVLESGDLEGQFTLHDLADSA